jgi:phosphatidylglycerophosphate synthase
LAFAAVGALLAVLAVLPGLGAAGWGAGLCCGAGLAAALHRGLAGTPTGRPGPADRLTSGRAVLACALAALVADAVTGRPHAAALLAVPAAVALALDLADGLVARRTGTVSAFGARFDGESDAFLIAVLSVAVAPTAGVWVLALGGIRYAFWVAGRCIPALRAQLPPRYWRKVVTAVVGISLVAAVSEVPPPQLALAGLVVSALLLAESFGRDVVWLWRHRAEGLVPPA